MNKDIRWIQRFYNFKRAFLLLNKAFEKNLKDINQLEKEGIIQRFEYTFELAWKTLKDKIENDGIILDKISPKAVVKKAYEIKYLNNAEIWLKMIGDRNLISHTYDFTTFEEIILSIKDLYLSVLNELYLEFLNEINQK
ncbi:MAG: nucleotidyltransferase [Desulfobacteraceae bacterium 4572_130]|nr:MAG: nucleotidyltransferase [Desulfobacteraceae bacterium 4572_130]